MHGTKGHSTTAYSAESQQNEQRQESKVTYRNNGKNNSKKNYRNKHNNQSNKPLTAYTGPNIDMQQPSMRFSLPNWAKLTRAQKDKIN